jgi:predicted house-cleaning noncanonical NTP pyrophosphatase (MazG superfamily)
MTCNRAKRAADETDFRRTVKLVRDKIPEIIRAEGRDVHVRSVSGTALTRALFEKLIEEHSELIAVKDDPTARQEELVDRAEVIMSLALQQGVTEEAFLAAVRKKRSEKEAFDKGYIFTGASG